MHLAPLSRRRRLAWLRRWWLYLLLLLRRRGLHLPLLWRSWRWLAMTWLRRRRLHLRPLRSRWRLAWSLRRLFLFLLISLWCLRHDEGMIKRRRVG